MRVIFLGIWEEAELILGIWGAKANTSRETRTLFAGRRGDQCIIFRDQGSTDPHWGASKHVLVYIDNYSMFCLQCRYEKKDF